MGRGDERAYDLRRIAGVLGLLAVGPGAAWATSVTPAPVFVVPTSTGTGVRLFFAGSDGLYELDPNSGRESRKIAREGGAVTAVSSKQLVIGDGQHSYFESGGEVFPVGAGYAPEGAIISARMLVFASRTRGLDGFDVSTRERRWHRDTKGFEVSILAAPENIVMTTGMLGTETRLRGLDYLDGSVSWTRDVGTMNGMTVSLSPDGSEVFVGAGTNLRRLDSKTGRSLGVVDLKAQIYNTLGIGPSSVIATTRTSTESRLWILSASLRKRRSYRLEHYVGSLCVGTDTIVVGLERRHELGRLAGYAVEDGTLKWVTESSWRGQATYCGGRYFYAHGFDGVEARRYEDGQTTWYRYRDGFRTR